MIEPSSCTKKVEGEKNCVARTFLGWLLDLKVFIHPMVYIVNTIFGEISSVISGRGVKQDKSDSFIHLVYILRDLDLTHY
jgi:hypothetical protein